MERDVINRMMRNGDAQVLSLRDAMDRLLEQSFTPFGRGFGGEGTQTVPSNLWEDGNTYYLHIQAPALDVSSVDITVVGGMLTVSGQDVPLPLRQVPFLPKPYDPQDIERKFLARLAHQG